MPVKVTAGAVAPSSYSPDMFLEWLIYLPVGVFVLGLLLARRGTLIFELLLAVGLVHMAGGVLVLAMGSPVREASEFALGAGVLAIVVSHALVSHYPLIVAPLVLAVVALGAALRWGEPGGRRIGLMTLAMAIWPLGLLALTLLRFPFSGR